MAEIERPEWLTDEQWKAHLEWLEEEKKKPMLRPVDKTGWITEPPPAQEWTVPNRFPRREVTLFSGAGGAGKSTIGLHLAAAHVLGKEWMLSLPEQGPAIFLDAEDDQGVIRRRLWHIGRHFGLSSDDELADLQIFSLHGKDALLAAVGKGGKIEPTKLYDELVAAARLFNPQTIVIASVANVYGGNEIDRAQVTQFIGLMNALAIEGNSSVIIISHPSVSGMATDSGISGSTQWHNAVRARMYLKAAKLNGGEEADPNLQVLEFRKNQYGKLGETVSVHWKDGLFLPVAGGPSSFDQLVRASKALYAVQTVIARYARDGFAVSSNPTSNNYAPLKIKGEPEGLEFTKPELVAAVEKLLADRLIHIETYGKASNPHQKLVPGPSPA